MSLSPEMLGIIAPAFAAGLVVASTHVPLGQEVLKRGIIFIDLAIAQIAALGIVVSHSVLHVESGLWPLMTALLFALTGGALFGWLEKKAPQYQEAFIGSAFVLSASLIILLVADSPHGGEEIQGLLAGQILWSSWKQVLITGFISVAILGVWGLLKSKRNILFYLLFPIAITLSVQLVGIYLVFASLIIPSLGAIKFKQRLLIAYIIAMLSVISGLILSLITDLPAGPVLVCSYSAVASGFYFLYQIRRSSVQ